MATRTILNTFSATGGFLANCRVEFAPGLTCIIGARGTCKSTLVESIRFAFDHGQDRVRALLGEQGAQAGPTFNLVRATLGAGSVRCETTDAGAGADHQSVQLIEREVGGEPRVYSDGVREHANRDVLHQIEVFSQGDLQLIADDQQEELRIALIDRPNASRVQALLADRENAEQSLREVGPDLRLVRAQVATIKQELQPLPVLREALRQARADSPAMSPELESERALHERRRHVLDALKELQAAREAALAHLDRAAGEADRIRSLVQRVLQDQDLQLLPVATELKAIEAAVGETLAGRERLHEVGLAGAVDALAKQFEEQSVGFYRMRQEQQAINEALKQQQHLSRQVETLEKRQKELDGALEREAKLLRDRSQARAATARVDDELFALRIREVDDINATHGEVVALTLKTGASSSRYEARVSSLLAGSRIRGQEEVAAALAETFSPAALIDIVESGNGQVLADTLRRDLGQMNRVVAHLAEHPEVYTLEAEPPAAKLEITLFDNGTPKPVETLSKGQRATALLPLVLRPLPYPLIIDQPEDDLDNNFIFNSLIKHIGKLKEERQLIFVTHNANIPVLGGADRVVVMHMQSPTSAAPCVSGTVDERKREILDLLEGGAEAFQRREERYHDLLAISERDRGALT